MQNIPHNSSDKSSRRGLLFGAATVGAVAVAVAALPRAATAPPETAVPQAMPEKGGGYSVSEHVKHYYRTALI